MRAIKYGQNLVIHGFLGKHVIFPLLMDAAQHSPAFRKEPNIFFWDVHGRERF